MFLTYLCPISPPLVLLPFPPPTRPAAAEAAESASGKSSINSLNRTASATPATPIAPLAASSLRIGTSEPPSPKDSSLRGRFSSDLNSSQRVLGAAPSAASSLLSPARNGSADPSKAAASAGPSGQVQSRHASSAHATRHGGASDFATDGPIMMRGLSAGAASASEHGVAHSASGAHHVAHHSSGAHHGHSASALAGDSTPSLDFSVSRSVKSTVRRVESFIPPQLIEVSDAALCRRHAASCTCSRLPLHPIISSFQLSSPYARRLTTLPLLLPCYFPSFPVPTAGQDGGRRGAAIHPPLGYRTETAEHGQRRCGAARHSAARLCALWLSAGTPSLGSEGSLLTKAGITLSAGGTAPPSLAA